MTADPPQAISRPRVGPGRPDRDPKPSKGRLRGRLRHASGIHDPHVCKCLHVFIPQIFHEHTWAQAPCCKSLAILPTSLTHTYLRPQLKSDAPAAGSHGARASLPCSCEPPALPGGVSLGRCTPVHAHLSPHTQHHAQHRESPRQGLVGWKRKHTPSLPLELRSRYLFRLQKEKPLFLPSPVFLTLFSMKVLLCGAQTVATCSGWGFNLKSPQNG